MRRWKGVGVSNCAERDEDGEFLRYHSLPNQREGRDSVPANAGAREE
jgi:hypothetical protein